jgi:hypothetical protein
VNASIDGIASDSDEPAECLKYMIYQRRMLVEAMKTKALLLATLDPDSAQKAAQEYFRLAIPVSAESEAARLRKRTKQLDEWTDMAPIPLSEVIVPDYSPRRAKARMAQPPPEGRPGPPVRPRRRR